MLCTKCMCWYRPILFNLIRIYGYMEIAAPLYVQYMQVQIVEIIIVRECNNEE